jgi:hypothetical protein
MLPDFERADRIGEFWGKRPIPASPSPISRSSSPDALGVVRNLPACLAGAAFDPVGAAELDAHVCSLFPRATWLVLIGDAGFEVRVMPLAHDERPVGAEGFLATRPR